MTERIKVLEEKLIECIESYYGNDNSLISDAEFDMLLHEYYNLCDKQNIEQHDKIRNVGFKSDRADVKLIKKMYSISNAFNEQDINDFIHRVYNSVGMIDFITERKIDGASVEVVYNYGSLVRGATRGNGEVGENITNNVKVLNIPHFIEELENIPTIAFYGEAYMEKSDLERINLIREQEGKKLLANSRNAAAGAMRQLDESVTKERNIKAFFFGTSDYQILGVSTQSSLLDKMASLGLPVEKNYRICGDIDDIMMYVTEIEEIRSSLEHDIDGVVIKVNNLDSHNTLGYTSKYPKFAVAVKLETEKAYTKVIDVDYVVGKTGVLTPVALLEPVRVAGSVIKRATLHNYSFIQELGLKIGDMVEIHKSGDVIPQILRPLEDLRDGSEKEIKVPVICKFCGESISFDEQVAIKCTNIFCPSAKVEKLKHFVSKKGLNIKGMGEKIVVGLYEMGILENYSDLYILNVDTLMYLDRVGEKLAIKIMTEIDKSKELSVERLIYALNIPYVGETTAKQVAQHFGNMDNMITASFADFLDVEGVGYETALSLFSVVGDIDFLEQIELLQVSGVNMDYLGAEVQRHENFDGVNFVITGSFEIGKRDDIKAIIEGFGGKVGSSVTSKTDVLICGENPGSKLVAANNYGISIWDENDLVGKMEGGVQND